MADKLLYTMGEVAELFDVNTSLIRHWEAQFPILRPQRNKKGNRLFSPADVENLKLIYHLVKERGMTLEGAKKAMRSHTAAPADGVTRDVELMERLQRVRSLLEEVREDLKAEVGELVSEPVGGDTTPRRPRAKAVQRIAEQTEGETAENAVRKPRRKKGDGENKELFAFYEQSLF